MKLVYAVALTYASAYSYDYSYGENSESAVDSYDYGYDWTEGTLSCSSNEECPYQFPMCAETAANNVQNTENYDSNYNEGEYDAYGSSYAHYRRKRAAYDEGYENYY